MEQKGLPVPEVTEQQHEAPFGQAQPVDQALQSVLFLLLSRSYGIKESLGNIEARRIDLVVFEPLGLLFKIGSEVDEPLILTEALDMNASTASLTFDLGAGGSPYTSSETVPRAVAS